jgi:hypothetical protein
MADDDTPIEGSPADTADATTSTHTSASTPLPNTTPSMTSFEAATTSTEPAQAPISISTTKSSRKRPRRITVATTLAADEQDKDQDTGKPAAKRTRRKKTIWEGEVVNKQARFSWLPASNEAFLDFLKLLITQGNETNRATFKATDYTDAISFISLKSGQVLTIEQLTNKYDYWKTCWREWEAHIKACSGWGRHEVTGLPYTDKPGVMDGYFGQHIKRRPFRKKHPPHFEQLKELLEGKMASGEYAASIDDALDENSAWNNQEDDSISLSDTDAERRKENEDTEHSNTPIQTIERSPSSTPIEGWSVTPSPASSSGLSTPSRSLSVLSVALSPVSQSPSPAIGKKPRNTQKAKDLNMVRRSTKNAAKAANRSYSSRTVKGSEALSESISKATAAFSALETTLLALKSSPIERAVCSFIKDFRHLTAADQQLVLKAFEVESRTYIFNSLSGDARNGYVDQLIVDMRPKPMYIKQLVLIDKVMEVGGELEA